MFGNPKPNTLIALMHEQSCDLLNAMGKKPYEGIVWEWTRDITRWTNQLYSSQRGDLLPSVSIAAHPKEQAANLIPQHARFIDGLEESSA